MNTYFATVSEKECDENCSYQSCPERYMSKLQELSSVSRISPLTDQSLFQPSMQSPLRSGDLLIVHAANRKDLERLIKNRKRVEQFRLILIIGEDMFRDSRNYHLLNPRYIMTTAQHIDALNEVVGKIANNKPGNASVSTENSFATP